MKNFLGKVSLSFTQKRDRSVVVDLRSDCDIVASTKLFEYVCKQVSDSVLAFLELQTPEFFSNKPHIFTINTTDLDYIPIQHSSQDTVGGVLKRVSSQFGKPVVAENIYVCHNKEGDFIGSYTHNTLPSSSEHTFVAKRAGIASLKCDCTGGFETDLKRFGDLIALQAVADPNFCTLDEFMSLKLLKYEEFNHMLTNLSDSVNKLKRPTDTKISQVKWTPINANTTVKEALEVVKFLNIPEISINALLYINAGKESVLVNK
eukprot:XP_764514.1 hypothetical protein [Theileria parva strain Muguga]